MTTPPSREPDDADRGILRGLGDAAALLALLLPAVGLLGRFLTFSLRGLPMAGHMATAETISGLALAGFADIFPGLGALLGAAVVLRAMSAFITRVVAHISRSKDFNSGLSRGYEELQSLEDRADSLEAHLGGVRDGSISPSEEVFSQLQSDLEEAKQSRDEARSFVDKGREKAAALDAEAEELMLSPWMRPSLLVTRKKRLVLVAAMGAVSVGAMFLLPWLETAFAVTSAALVGLIALSALNRGQVPRLSNLWPAVVVLGLFGSILHAMVPFGTPPAQYHFTSTQVVEDGRYLLLGVSDSFTYLWPCESEEGTPIAVDSGSVTSFTPQSATVSAPSLLDVIREGNGWMPSLADVCSRQP